LVTLYAVDELVAEKWLRLVLPGVDVATTLPDASSWTDNQFVQITGVGGSPDPEQPVYRPVIEAACFAYKPGSKKPPWFQANQLAVRIYRHCVTFIDPDDAVLALGDGYEQARVLERIPQTTPRRGLSDSSHYARYNIEVELVWVPHVVVTQ
jgi:hypothetical protein